LRNAFPAALFDHALAGWQIGFIMPHDPTALEPDPIIELYKRDVDLTLLRENLRRSVEERFERLMALQELAAELQRGMASAQRRK
jgi:hypothetical protein